MCIFFLVLEFDILCENVIRNNSAQLTQPISGQWSYFCIPRKVCKGYKMEHWPKMGQT